MKRIFIIILAISSMVITGEALSFGWNVFVATTFAVPKINIWSMLALVQMYELVKWRYKKRDYTIDEYMDAAIAGVSVSSFTLMILFVLSLF